LAVTEGDGLISSRNLLSWGHCVELLHCRGI
jgi:hypothetical protein